MRRDIDFEQKIFNMAAAEKMILPESVNEKINDTLVNLPIKHKNPPIIKMTWKRAVVLAAAIMTLMSFTVSAAVSAYRQRLEAMNEQEIEDYFINIYSSKIGHDNYNRPFTDSETERMDSLRLTYENEALFPKASLTMISDPEEYKGKGVAFYGNTATFFLPEKELGDEELLEIIDFLHKRDYSLARMNEMIEEGNMTFPSEEIEAAKDDAKDGKTELTDLVILGSEAVWEPDRELTIQYRGDLEMTGMDAGQNCIFLMGWNAVHKMEIGSDTSELFFDDFDVKSMPTAIYQDKKGDIYMALMEQTDEETCDFKVSGEPYKNALWILSPEGEVKKKLALNGDGLRVIRRMAVDEQGYIYIRTDGSEEELLRVFNGEGEIVKKITADPIKNDILRNPFAGLGMGKDGKIYIQVEAGDVHDRHMGIASVDLEKGCLDEVYMGIVPDNTIMLDIIAPGSDTDFVFWGYDGIFTYNLGDKSAVNVLPAYEAPCDWEGALYCALPDGRIVFADCSGYRIEEEGQDAVRIPENVRFYYKTTVGKSK